MMTGTEKQVAFANDSKARFLSHMDEMIAITVRRVEKGQSSQAQLDEARRLREIASDNMDHRFWIDNDGRPVMTVLRAMTK